MIHRLPTLGVPLRSPRLTWLGCGALLAYYVASMARDLCLYDSPLLATAAVQLGLAHAPGQPLHTLLGFVFAHLPGVPPLWGLNLLSAVAGALCILPAASLAEGLSPSHGAQRGHRVLLVAVLVLTGMHSRIWEGNTRVEVYPLATLCCLWAIARTAACLRSGGGDDAVREMAFAGLGLGLGACANPVIAGLSGLSLAPWVGARLLQRRLPAVAAAAAVGGGMLGLLPYLYVPLVADRTDVLAWGAPADLQSAIHYFLGRDYARSFGIKPGAWLAHVGDWLRWANSVGFLSLLLLGLLGHAVLGRGIERLAAPLAFGLTLVLIARNTVWEPEIPDYVAYFGMCAWWAAAGTAALGAQAARGQRPWLACAPAVLTALLTINAAPAPWTRTRHADRVARVLGSGALSEAAPGSIVIAQSDHWVAPMLYLQEVERQRPDVVLVAFGLSSSTWYWEHLFRRHPELQRIQLQGPFGRVGRLRRLLTANPARPVRFEDAPLARQLGVRACVDGWLRSPAACDTATRADTVEERQLASLADKLGRGSPSGGDAVAGVALRRGLDLIAEGDTTRALLAMLSGVPRELAARDLPELSDDARQLGVAWQRRGTLGHPRRNLYVAAMLLAEAGHLERATPLMRAAARLGSPEAQAMLDP